MSSTVANSNAKFQAKRTSPVFAKTAGALVNNLNKNAREDNLVKKSWWQSAKKPFIPDDGKQYEMEIKMPTAEHTWLNGHVPEEQMPPIPSIKFKGVTRRNWLMRRPAGRLLAYGLLILVAIFLLVTFFF